MVCLFCVDGFLIYYSQGIDFVNFSFTFVAFRLHFKKKRLGEQSFQQNRNGIVYSKFLQERGSMRSLLRKE